MRFWFAWVLSCLVFTLLLAGCGGQSGSSDGGEDGGGQNPCAGVTPGNGGEGEPCVETGQCDGRQYCNHSRCVCYPPGECVGVSDCEQPDNEWTHDACTGTADCQAGLCSWTCT